MLKKQNGVTLVALVITVIVLIILAGITISLVLGDNGIMQKTQQAGQDYKNAENIEAADMDEAENVMNTLMNQYRQ